LVEDWEKLQSRDAMLGGYLLPQDSFPYFLPSLRKWGSAIRENPYHCTFLKSLLFPSLKTPSTPCRGLQNNPTVSFQKTPTSRQIQNS
jgi:hypothetical protein